MASTWKELIELELIRGKSKAQLWPFAKELLDYETAVELLGPEPANLPKPEPIRHPYYYEWHATDCRWYKVADQNPDPPAYLSPGEFDGQMVEIYLDTNAISR